MTSQHGGQELSSIFTEWDTRATVRSAPRRVVEASSGLPYSPDVVPVMGHPLVAALPTMDRHALLARELYSHLDFTICLEQGFVNPVLAQLGSGEIPFDVPSSARFTAHKIYCDEAYHALFSADLKWQVQEQTAVEPLTNYPPALLARLERVLSSAPAGMREVAHYLFVTVSETLISGVLTRVPADDRVVDCVRDTIADHATDERLHHAFFAKLFELTWRQLSVAERAQLAPLFGRFIDCFLEPDWSHLTTTLAVAGFDELTARRIVRETYVAQDVSAAIKRSSRATRALLRRHGVACGEPLSATPG